MKKSDLKKTIKKLRLTPAVSLILAGVFLMTISFGCQIKNALQQNALKKAHAAETNYQIKNISIPSLSINLPVKKGGIVSGQWILNDNSAMVLPESDQPGDAKNTIIYAHNKPNLFANLKNTQVNDQIILESENGQQLTYQISSLENAQPEEVQKLQSEEPNTLILFTCDGPFDQSRLIIKAKLQ